MSSYTISIAQMNIALGDVEQNLKTFRQMSAEAAQQGSEFVLFPELWSTGYVLEEAEKYASRQGEGIYQAIQQTAQDCGITIVGSVLEKTDSGIANSLHVATPDGKIAGTYHKLHLFRLFDEHKYLQEGDSTLCLPMAWGKTGYGICYDLRFPELFRGYSIHDGAQCIVLPAEWPLIRVEHWRTLLIARAIENQAFVIACNAVGKTGETVFAGHSMLIDPWGKVILEAGESPQLITGQMDTAALADVRSRIPVFEDLRHDIYGA